MTADFDAVRLKLARSKERLDALRIDVDDYLSTDPCRITDEADGNRFALRSWVDTEPEQEWAVDVSEVAVAARSVLDQLVWQLVIANGNDPSGGRTQFPIATDFDKYAKGKKPQRDRLLQGVASKHRDIIDSYQPYQLGPRQAKSEPLYVLSEIANSEKHRAGHVVLGAAKDFTVKLLRPEIDDLVVSFKKALPLKNDSEIFAVDNQPNPAAPHLVVTLELDGFEADVGFQDGDRMVMLADLELALLRVATVVERCIAKV